MNPPTTTVTITTSPSSTVLYLSYSSRPRTPSVYSPRTCVAVVHLAAPYSTPLTPYTPPPYSSSSSTFPSSTFFHHTTLLINPLPIPFSRPRISPRLDPAQDPSSVTASEKERVAACAPIYSSPTKRQPSSRQQQPYPFRPPPPSTLICRLSSLHVNPLVGLSLSRSSILDRPCRRPSPADTRARESESQTQRHQKRPSKPGYHHPLILTHQTYEIHSRPFLAYLAHQREGP